MAVLVTGAAGFIGSHVVEALLETGHDVVALDDLSGGFLENVPDGTAFYQGSVLDVDLLARLFSEHRITHVFHLAAYAAEGLSHFIRRFNYGNNVIGSMNLVNEAIKAEVECFVFTSSIAVYGAGRTPMHEGLVPRPEDPYGIAKLAVELDLDAAHRQFGLNYIVFRPHNVYGERQHIGDRYRNVVGIFMNQLMRGEPMPIFGDGTQSRAFTYVADVAPMIAGAIHVPEARNEVFNVGADEAVTVLELATLVAEAMNRPPIVDFLPARNEVCHAWADHAKLAQVFGRTPRWPLRDGLARMAQWAQRVGPRAPGQRFAVEVSRGLPSRWKE